MRPAFLSRTTAIALTGFLFLGLSSASPSFANSCIGNELFRNHETLTNNRFPIWRNLSHYSRFFGHTFWNDLKRLPAGEIGSADIITDIHGPFAYSAAPDQVLRKYMQILKKDGSAYIFLRTQGLTIDNHAQGLGQYLSSIRGAEVQWLGESSPGFASFRLKKVSDHVEVPVLHQIHFRAGDPFHRNADPDRWFRR